MHQLIKSVSIALLNIRSNPLHTVLSTLGIIIGVAALVGILSLGDGLEQTAREQIETTTALQMMVLSPRSSNKIDEVWVQRDTIYRFTENHVSELENKLGEGASLDLMARSTGRAVYKDSVIGVYLQGTTYRSKDLIPPEYELTGAYHSDESVKVPGEIKAVLSQAVAGKWSLKNEEAVGQRIEINGIPFEISGILKGGSTERLTIMIPVESLLELKEELSRADIVVKAENVENLPGFKEAAAEWLMETFGENETAFSLSTNEMRVEQLSQGILVFKLVMGAITGISVLVGGIGIMNVLLISVTERTREIGIRKATGAKKKDIILQFLSESVTISLAGCALGAVVGFAGTLGIVQVINYYTDFNFSVAFSAGTLVSVLIIALAVGIIFGTYPAYRAADLTPVDAIRHE